MPCTWASASSSDSGVPAGFSDVDAPDVDGPDVDGTALDGAAFDGARGAASSRAETHESTTPTAGFTAGEWWISSLIRARVLLRCPRSGRRFLPCHMGPNQSTRGRSWHRARYPDPLTKSPRPAPARTPAGGAVSRRVTHGAG